MFIQNSYCFFRTLFVIHLLSSCLFSYAELKDNQYWFDIDFSKKITKSLDMDIAHRVRYKSDELAADKNSTDFSLSYAINSKFKLSGDLRYDSRVEESEYRVGINLKFDPQISNIIPVYKIKLQKEYNNHKVEEFFIRNKFSFSIMNHILCIKILILIIKNIVYQLLWNTNLIHHKLWDYSIFIKNN